MVQHMDSATASVSPALVPGAVCWAWLDPAVGREQGGRRPVVVVSGAEYLSVVDTLAMVVPVTGVDRGWDNHVEVSIGAVSGWAMTEQVRTISRERFADVVGVLTSSDFDKIRSWISDFLDLSPHDPTSFLGLSP